MAQRSLRIEPIAVITMVLHWMIIATAFLMPLLFFVNLNDPFELPKQLLLGIVGIAAATLWLLRMIVAKEFRWVGAWGLLWWGLFVIVVIVSAFLSVHPHTSWLGDHGQEWASASTAIALFVFGLVAMQEFAEKQWHRLLSAITISSGIASTLFLLGLAKIFVLPWKETNAQLFTPVGDVVATAMLAAVALVLSNTQFFVMGIGAKPESRLRRFHQGLHSLLLLVIVAVSLAVLAVVGIKELWVVVLAANVLMYSLIMGRANELATTHRWVVIFFTAAISIFFLLIPSRWTQQLPPFVFMSWRESAHVAQETVRSSPLLGSGPSTFSIDVSRFHTAQALRETFGILFDRARSTPLTQIASLGVVGGIIWLILMIGLLLRSALLTLLKKDPNHRWLLLMTLTSGWAVALVAEAVLPATLATHFVFWTLTAGMIWALSGTKEHTVSLASSHRTRIALVSMCCIATLLIPIVGWGSYNRAQADKAFARALQSTGTLDARRQAIRDAIGRESTDDVYYRQAGMLELAKFQEVATTVKDSEERLQQLRILARDTIVLSRTATELHPNSAANWQSLAGIYQQFTTAVEGSEEEALKALEQLRMVEPNNPVHFTDTASIFIARADREQALADKANKEKITTAFLDAEEMLTRALALDPEFAPAHFQSAILAERRGKLQEAIAQVEALARTRPQDLPLHLQLGALYLKNNQKDLAEKIWNAIIGVKADYANARWYLANLYEEEKRFDDTLKQLEEIQKTNKDNPQLGQRIEELQKLKSSGGAVVSEPLNPKISLPK